MERTVLHIVGGPSRSRAEQARIAFSLGHHAEVYHDMDELLARPPREGVILASDPYEPDAVRALVERIERAGTWLPLVMVSEAIDAERVVDALHAGAIDYLALPLEINRLARRLPRILAEAERLGDRRRAEAAARHRIRRLSPREREVLMLLSQGQTNKMIAITLGISPRTVEIHRANMMEKLGASHPADAVLTWFLAGAAPAEPAVRADSGAAPIRLVPRPPEPAEEALRRQRQ